MNIFGGFSKGKKRIEEYSSFSLRNKRKQKFKKVPYRVLSKGTTGNGKIQFKGRLAKRLRKT